MLASSGHHNAAGDQLTHLAVSILDPEHGHVRVYEKTPLMGWVEHDRSIQRITYHPTNKNVSFLEFSTLYIPTIMTMRYMDDKQAYAYSLRNSNVKKKNITANARAVPLWVPN